MNDGVAKTEHMLAYVMAAVAIALGAIGLLVGFGMFGGEDVALEEAGNTAGNTNFQDGMLWLLPAISAALLSYALHQTDHHRSSMRSRSDAAEAAYGGEHLLAYVVAAGAIALGAIGMLVGFDVLDDGYTAEEGYLWLVGSIGLGVLTNTLHAVRHHVYEHDEAYIVSVIERRGMGTPPVTAAETTTVRERGHQQP